MEFLFSCRFLRIFLGFLEIIVGSLLFFGVFGLVELGKCVMGLRWYVIGIVGGVGADAVKVREGVGGVVFRKEEFLGKRCVRCGGWGLG